MNAKSSMSPRELVDEYFIENRTRLLEIAAFLDRLDRAYGDASYATVDFRMKAFAEALHVLDAPSSGALDAPSGGALDAPSRGALDASRDRASRIDRIQHILSDPRTEPLDVLDRKSALGAYDRWSDPAASGPEREARS
jgi:hypothetical protein